MNTGTWAPKRADYDEFYAAVAAGAMEAVRLSLSEDIDINALFGEDGDGETALHVAAAAGNSDIVEFLISHGALVDRLAWSNFGSRTPLHAAAFSGQCQVVEVLLNKGADINAICEQQGETLLQVLWNKDHVVIWAGYIETIVLLLDRGSDIHSMCLEVGGTVLNQAAELGLLDLIQLLIDKGADINFGIQTCGSALQSSVFYGTYDTAQFLLQRGASVDKVTLAAAKSTAMMELLISYAEEEMIHHCGALHRACDRGTSGMELILFLLSRKLDINGLDEWGDTPLLSVCSSDHPCLEIIQFLISNGADVSARSIKAYGGHVKKGDTPLHRASWRSYPSVVKLLLEAGADVATRNGEEETPLIKYAYMIDGVSQNFNPMLGHTLHPRLQSFKMIVDAGADVNASDLKKRTALHALALSRGSPSESQVEAIRILIDAGVAVRATDDEGRTALDILLDQKNQEAAKLFSKLPGEK